MSANHTKIEKHRSKRIPLQAIAVFSLAIIGTAFGQGTIHFNNRVPGVVDARMFIGGCPVEGPQFKAQLYVGPAGASMSTLRAVTPATALRTGIAAGYVEPIDVTVPGIAGGSRATVVMRIFNGATYESSSIFGTTAPIEITLGGAGTPPTPPAMLVGLLSFTTLSGGPCGPPSIPVKPESLIRHIGETAYFFFPVAWDPPISYQWLHNGVPIQGATLAALTLTNVQRLHAGKYSVLVSGAQRELVPTILTVIDPEPRGDFNRDGRTDLIFQNDDGFLAIWHLDGAKMTSARFLVPDRLTDPKFRIAASADFDWDGKEDLLFQHSDGTLAVWFMDGTQLSTASLLSPSNPADRKWRVVATGDFDQDGKADLLFQHEDGTMVVWFMDGIKLSSVKLLTPSHPGNEEWRVAGVGDFDGNGTMDLVLQRRNGRLAVWLLVGTTLNKAELGNPDSPGDARWRVSGVADLNQDSKPDLVFQHEENGTLAAWLMDGVKLAKAQLLDPSQPGSTWKIVAPR